MVQSNAHLIDFFFNFSRASHKGLIVAERPAGPLRLPLRPASLFWELLCHMKESVLTRTSPSAPADGGKVEAEEGLSRESLVCWAERYWAELSSVLNRTGQRQWVTGARRCS